MTGSRARTFRSLICTALTATVAVAAGAGGIAGPGVAACPHELGSADEISSCLADKDAVKTSALLQLGQISDHLKAQVFDASPPDASGIEEGLASLSAACTTQAMEAPLPAVVDLGCRGNDHRCKDLEVPTAENKMACLKLRTEGADCVWARQDPRGYCSGNSWQCGLVWYETQWLCERVHCTWKWHPTTTPAPSPGTVEVLESAAESVAERLNELSPEIGADANVLASHLISGDCGTLVEAITSAARSYVSAVSDLKAALDLSSEPPALESVTPSPLAQKVSSFQEEWAPTDVECKGSDSRCSGPSMNKENCASANYDCYWATDDPTGTCTGNDGRCKDADKTRCNALKAENARCNWVWDSTFTGKARELKKELSDITGSPTTLSAVLKGGTQRVAAISNAASQLQSTALPALHTALGMPQ